MPRLFATPLTYDPSSAAVVLLILLQIGLGTVMVCLLVFCLLPFGTVVAIASAVMVHVVGFGSTRVLSCHIPRLAPVWAICFALSPAAVTPFAAYEYFLGDANEAFGFWSAFTFSLFAASFLGGVVGVSGLTRSTATR